MARTAETMVMTVPKLHDAYDAGYRDGQRVVMLLQDGPCEPGHLLDPLVLTKDFADTLHRFGASNERLAHLAELEKEVLGCGPPEELLPLRHVLLCCMMSMASQWRLDQDCWFSAVALLDHYMAATKDSEEIFSMLPLTCVAVVRISKKFHGHSADQIGSKSAQWLQRAQELGKMLQSQGHMVEVEFNEAMLSQSEIDILQALQWQIDVPLLQQWLHMYCTRFDILTENRHEDAVACVKPRSMFFARLFLLMEASSERNTPREASLGLFCLGLALSQLISLQWLRPDKVSVAEWEHASQQAYQWFQVPLPSPNAGVSLYELIQATTGASSYELKQATHPALTKILVLGAQHPAFQLFRC